MTEKMSISEAIKKAKPNINEVAELLVYMGYTPNDFRVVLSDLIHEEMKLVTK